MMRALVLVLCVLLATPAWADMFQDGSNAKIPEAQMNLGMAAAGNPKDFDPLCDGRTTEAEVVSGTAHDCSAAINSAAAIVINGKTANVQLQPGVYYLTNTVNLLTGQTLMGAGRARTFIRVRDTFNPAAQGVIILTGSTATFGEFGGLRDLTISFSQALNQTSRANFQLLGTCTSHDAGTGCKYPPAVLVTTGRTFFDRVKIEKAWDGIASDSVATVNSPGGTGASTVNIHDMQMSAFNTGLWIDGPKDSSYIERFHFWTFGFQITHPIYANVFDDGNVDCMRMGNMDGLIGVNLFCHGANMRFVESVLAPGDAVAGQLTNVVLDSGGRFIVEATNNLVVNNMMQSSEAGGAVPPNCALTMNSATSPADRVIITNYWVQNHTDTMICVYAGFLQIDNARMISFADRPSALVNGGSLFMRNIHWGGHGTAIRTAPVIQHLAGSLVLADNTWTGPAVGGGGVVIQLSSDGTGNMLTNNINPRGYGISFGCGPTTAGWCFTGIPQGFYDLPAHPFTQTVTPTFTGTTDFAVTNKGTNGQWWLRGNRVEFWLREEFDSNAHTSGNNFILQTTMPMGANLLGSSRTCAAQRTDKVTWAITPPRCAIGDNAGGTASDISFYQPVSGGTITQLSRADMPASTADFLFAISGWYPIR